MNHAAALGWAVGALRPDAAVVNPYSVEARYPGIHLDPTLTEARLAAGSAEELTKMVEQLLQA